MSDLIEDGPASGPTPGNTPEYSVSEISGAVKRAIEGNFARVRVRGEIGRVSRPRSGHVYLDLKDERAVLSGVIWKGVAARLATRPEEGLEVVATGRLTTFPGQSKYQIVIESITPAGAGALMAMLERRKAMLAAEGLFAPERKKPIPFIPGVIGVITSPSGAVIRDILHRLRDRFPRHVLIWPVAVQGQACAPEVARAIEGFNRLAPGGPIPRPDLLIVARGGGSLEDLWGFNEEIVARAAAASEIPLISAVGHETDTTLIDYVADRRAPTPTAAAEMAVPVRLELMAAVDSLGGRLVQALMRRFELSRQRLRDLARALPRPEALAQAPRQRLDMWGERLAPALRQLVQQKRLMLERRAAPLQPRALAQLHANRSERLSAGAARLEPALRRTLAERRRACAELSARLQRLKPIEDLGRRALELGRLEARLHDLARRRIEKAGERLAALARMHQTLGYRETLKRGYAVVWAGGHVAARKAEAARARALEIEFADGRLAVGGRKGARAARPGDEPDQGSLF